jgi:hypothetical protein
MAKGHLFRGRIKHISRNFRPYLPPMVAALKEPIDRNEEERIMQTFEGFQTLLGCDYQLVLMHF